MSESTSKAHCDLSVVVPVHHSADFLKDRLTLLSDYLEALGISYEIIPVDDASKDETPAILRALRLPHMQPIYRTQNGGKFAAIRAGMARATGACRVFTDADIPYELSAIHFALERVRNEGHPIVIGDRTLSDSYATTRPPFLRRATTRMFSACVRLLVGSELYDTQCGFKAFRGDVATHLFPLLKERRFAGDVELLAIARHHQIDVIRIPVTLRFHGKTTVRPLQDGFEMLQSLNKIRLRRAQGLYDCPHLAQIKPYGPK